MGKKAKATPKSKPVFGVISRKLAKMAAKGFDVLGDGNRTDTGPNDRYGKR